MSLLNKFMESSWQVFTGISTAAVAIAIITFLWKRRGRLWIFYYSIISKSIEQFKTDSLDFVKWEEIAFQNCDLLVKDLSGSLFRFEIEYLRKIIIDNKYLLWISDSSTTVEKVIDDHLNLKWVEKSIKRKILYSFFEKNIFWRFSILWHRFIFKIDLVPTVER
ncbi:MAG: hypothetical protein HZC52_02870 [Planctomycetes bacterium]|nr:hypothetical protein [Planctomycetota bacterium]